MKKRWLLSLLILALGLLPATAFAAEMVAEEVLTQQTTVVSDVELPENDELYEGYLEEMFYGREDVALFGTTAGEKLTGDEKLAYDALKPFITKIANGERASTIVTLGKHVQYYDENENLVDCPVDKTVTFKETRSDFDSNALVDALLLDMPYDLYWYNKLAGTQVGFLYQAETDPVLQMTFYFTAAKNYAGTEAYTVDTEKQAIAKTAVANAAAIVEKYEGKTDYEKLLGYKDEICDLAVYHYAAGSGKVNYHLDIDPWQLIYVFDKNFLTDVVCEGYSKAFQYLCDMSDFKDTTCYTITGYSTAYNGSGKEDVAGAHMWNIVTLEGENYMVDVTNSDSGAVGVNGELFMKAPISGSAKNGYSFACAGQTRIFFEYDDGDLLDNGSREMDMFVMVGEDVLNLAASDYNPNFSAPDLTLVTEENDPSGLPVGAVYYTNFPDDPELEIECLICILDPSGEEFEEYYEIPDLDDPIHPIEMGVDVEGAMVSGTYTIKAKYVQYDELIYDETDCSEETVLEYAYTHPGVAFKTPVAGWDGTDIQVTIPNDVSDDNYIACELEYCENGSDKYYGFAYANPTVESVKEDFERELADLKDYVAEGITDGYLSGDGVYKYRLRTLSGDICTKYHSSWSDWCELTEKAEEPTPGDLNGDGVVEKEDVQGILEHVLNAAILTDAEKLAADVTGDGKFDMDDVVQALRRALGFY